MITPRSTRILRRIAAGWLILLVLLGAAAEWIAPHSYAEILTEIPDAKPSRDHLMGTDSISRDRFSRLIYGTRIALLAPAAAVVATALGALAGGAAAMLTPAASCAVIFLCELFLSLPWMFLLISARALLPLNASPTTSVFVTFGLLACLGWAGPAGVIRERTRQLWASDFVRCSQALGISPARLFFVHIPPALRPVLLAQFWIAIPIFILSEANLSLVGLGVSDPLASWGSLLRDCEQPGAIVENPAVLAPLFLLISAALCAQILLRDSEALAQ